MKIINKDFEILDTTLFVSGNLSDLNSKLDVNNSFNIKDNDILYVIPSFWYKCKKYDEFTNNTSILTHPYNLYSSFNLGIHSLNIENFLFNFASRLVDKSLPYINGLNLTVKNTENEFFSDKKNKLSNVFLLPCDDGNFLHDANFITNEIKFQTQIINPILKDRLTIIKFTGYSVEEKICIVKDFIIPNLLKNIGFLQEDINITNDTIKFIINTYTHNEDGVRNIKRVMEEIFLKINLLKLIKTNKTNIGIEYNIRNLSFPLTITCDIIKNLLKV